MPSVCVGDGSCWMQMDLGAERRVSGVVTQDDTWFGRYVKTFRVTACAQADIVNGECVAWMSVDGGATFQGPSHGCNPPIWDCAGNGLTGMRVPVNALFSNYVEARFIRIHPLSYHRSWHMRAAVLVIEYPPSPPAQPFPPSPPPPSQPPPSQPPLPGAPIQTGGTFTVPRSAPGELQRLVRVRIVMADTASGHWTAPAARSYDGEDWEPQYPPLGVPRTVVNCTQAACTLTLPEAESGYAYRLEVFNSSVEGLGSMPLPQLHLRKAAKFLIQSTFGPKSNELHALAARLADGTDEQVFGDWVVEQIAMRPSSHRGHYRAHLNSRSTPGYARLACEPMSRWHRYAFTTLDVADRVNITVSIDTNGVRSIFVKNVLRTQIPDFSTFDPSNVLQVAANQSWYGYLCRFHTNLVAPSALPTCYDLTLPPLRQSFADAALVISSLVLRAAQGGRACRWLLHH